MFWILLVPHYGLILQRCAAIWLDIVEGMGELTTWCGKWENIRSLPSLSILCIVCLIIQCFCWFLQLIYCKWIWLSDYYWVYNFHWRWLLCQVWEVGLSTFFQTPARTVEPSKGETMPMHHLLQWTSLFLVLFLYVNVEISSCTTKLGNKVTWLQEGFSSFIVSYASNYKWPYVLPCRSSIFPPHYFNFHFN